MKQILRLLALVLVLCALFAMFGCAEQPGGPQETESVQDKPFDPENPYLIMATDIANGTLSVINLDAEDPMDPKSYYWHWTADPALGWKHGNKLPRNLSDARLRWSELHQSYVVLMTAASGWLGIAEYPSGKCLWETINTETGPHALEMLPNGDLVVACSGAVRWETEGCLVYLDTTDGKSYTATSKVMFPSAHGVLWDPEYNVLWADSFDNLVAFDIVDGEKGKPGLSERTDKLGAMLVSGNGHDLMPDYSDPNLLWITCDKSVVKYDKTKDKILGNYTYSKYVSSKYRVKGITSFPDGTVAYSKTGQDTNDWLDVFYVLWPLDLEGKEAVEVEYKAQDGSFWNKVRVFDPDYQ